MKTNKYKLFLNKETIAVLKDVDMNKLNGGNITELKETKILSVCPTYVPIEGMLCCV